MSNNSINGEIGNGGNQGHHAIGGRRTLEEQLQDLTVVVANLTTRVDQMTLARQPMANPQAPLPQIVVNEARREGVGRIIRGR